MPQAQLPGMPPLRDALWPFRRLLQRVRRRPRAALPRGREGYRRLHDVAARAGAGMYRAIAEPDRARVERPGPGRLRRGHAVEGRAITRRAGAP